MTAVATSIRVGRRHRRRRRCSRAANRLRSVHHLYTPYVIHRTVFFYYKNKSADVSEIICLLITSRLDYT